MRAFKKLLKELNRSADETPRGCVAMLRLRVYAHSRLTCTHAKRAAGISFRVVFPFWHVVNARARCNAHTYVRDVEHVLKAETFFDGTAASVSQRTVSVEIK